MSVITVVLTSFVPHLGQTMQTSSLGSIYPNTINLDSDRISGHSRAVLLGLRRKEVRAPGRLE